MARADTPTLLSLDRFAMIFGINPAHFNQAAGVAADSVMPVGGACTDLWFQASWQHNDRVGREDIALEIATAEEDIARVVGFWPAPKWIDDEIHQYPRHHRRDVYAGGYNVRGMRKSIITNYAKIIDMGQRALTTIGTATGATLVFSDEDTDGYSETVTITLPLPAALATFTNTCEVKTYFDGENTLDWEIRPPRTVTITGGNVIITFWAWQFIDPALWDAFPTVSGGLATLDLEGSIYVDTVDVYREFNDTTAQSAEFFWEPDPANVLTRIICSSCGGTGCAACALTTQDGCVRIRDVHAGIIVPEPATFDEDEEAWESQAWTECREPDQVKVWYYAGDLDQRFLAGRSCEALSNFWAQTIAWLAVARLERDLCSCANRTNLVRKLRTDMSFSSREGGSFILTDSDLGNPFGTLGGEIRAWRRVSKVVGLKAKAAVIP